MRQALPVNLQESGPSLRTLALRLNKFSGDMPPEQCLPPNIAGSLTTEGRSLALAVHFEDVGVAGELVKQLTVNAP